MFLLLAIQLMTATAPSVDHVVIVSIDGLRPDAIPAAPAPALLALIESGTYAPRARTDFPSKTLPCHTSMLTGIDIERHGVEWNEYRPGHIARETVFSFVEKVDSSISTAMIFGKSKFRFLAPPGNVDHLYGPMPRNKDDIFTARNLAEHFRRIWPAARRSVTFVHIREPDVAGHHYGWMGRRYLRAVRQSDQAVAEILKEIISSGERVGLIITSDHGGDGRDHYADNPRNRTIPWLYVGPGATPGRKITDRTVRVFDTMPTALRLLGIEPPRNLDGELVHEIFSSRR